MFLKDLPEDASEYRRWRYYAKDSVLGASSFGRIHGDQAAAEFRALKRRLDPSGILATDLSRRMLGESVG